jgi:hypothetical protein
MHTYRRIEKGENEKIAFDDAINIGTRAYHLTPNEIASMAGLWEMPEEWGVETDAASAVETIANALASMPPERRDFLIDLFTALIDIERKRLEQNNEDEEVSLAVLPTWMRRRMRLSPA